MFSRGLLAVALVSFALAAPAAAAPARPVASFVYAPQAPSVGEPVSFDASSSSGGDAPVVSYRWDFGDGTIQTHPTALATHTYALPGTYTVTLTTAGPTGPPHTDTATRTVTVAPLAQTPPRAPPTAPAPLADCGDRIDNDGDGRVDFPGDPGCSSAADPSEPEGTMATPGPALLTPFPVVRIVGASRGSGGVVRLLAVRAPVGSSITVRCRGRGCPLRRQTRQVRRLTRVRLRRFERYLSGGVTLGVYVRKPGLIGKYTRFRIRSRRGPARVDRCVKPGVARPVACPRLPDAPGRG